MDIQRILKFLKAVSANNNRPWFQEHKAEYEACKADFMAAVEELIARLSAFDSSISHLTAKDCIYRFYRDTRFSEDKSPYKRHFGAYICENGKKSLHAGYYIHIEPGKCFLSAGSYWLPTNILTACRNEIMANIAEWQKAVTGGKFVKLFGYPGEGKWSEDSISEKGFGLSSLKVCPTGFPKDYEHIEYLRMKDYACWHVVDERFFENPKWMEQAIDIFKVCKPMMDFINSVVRDYDE